MAPSSFQMNAGVVGGSAALRSAQGLWWRLPQETCSRATATKPG